MFSFVSLEIFMFLRLEELEDFSSYQKTFVENEVENIKKYTRPEVTIIIQ